MSLDAIVVQNFTSPRMKTLTYLEYFYQLFYSIPENPKRLRSPLEVYKDNQIHTKLVIKLDLFTQKKMNP